MSLALRALWGRSRSDVETIVWAVSTCHDLSNVDARQRPSNVDMTENPSPKRSQVHFDRCLWHDWLDVARITRGDSCAEPVRVQQVSWSARTKAKCNFNQLVSASFRVEHFAPWSSHASAYLEGAYQHCVKWAEDKCQTLLDPAAVIFYCALCRRLFHNRSLNWNKLPGDDVLASARLPPPGRHFSNQFKKALLESHLRFRTVTETVIFPSPAARKLLTLVPECSANKTTHRLLKWLFSGKYDRSRCVQQRSGPNCITTDNYIQLTFDWLTKQDRRRRKLFGWQRAVVSQAGVRQWKLSSHENCRCWRFYRRNSNAKSLIHENKK